MNKGTVLNIGKPIEIFFLFFLKYCLSFLCYVTISLFFSFPEFHEIVLSKSKYFFRFFTPEKFHQEHVYRPLHRYQECAIWEVRELQALCFVPRVTIGPLAELWWSVQVCVLIPPPADPAQTLPSIAWSVADSAVTPDSDRHCNYLQLESVLHT